MDISVDELVTGVGSHQIEDDSEYLCSDIIQKCESLLGEIDQLQTYISNNKRYRPIELRRFQSNIRSEIEFIKKVSPFQNLLVAHV